jgi:hypothetical protein
MTVLAPHPSVAERRPDPRELAHTQRPGGRKFPLMNAPPRRAVRLRPGAGRRCPSALSFRSLLDGPYEGRDPLNPRTMTNATCVGYDGCSPSGAPSAGTCGFLRSRTDR